MRTIERRDYPQALSLFRNSPHQMKLVALAEDLIEASVWADGPDPSVAAVRYQNKLLIASPLEAVTLAEILAPFLAEQIYGRGREETQLFWDGEQAREAILAALAGRHPAWALREYWELEPPCAVNRHDGPGGYELLPVDGALLARGLGNTDRLLEEMQSERVSVEAFLGQSFGVCAVQDGDLAGWCLSEYNCSAGCEVGIEVLEGHRRRGLALAMVTAFAEAAAARGARRVGWHCFQANEASRSTARAAGFAKALEYGELICFRNTALQYAVNGNFADGTCQHEEAAGWYRRSAQEPDTPVWAHMRLAMALASLGRTEEAFTALENGIKRGFHNWGWLRAEQRLEPLRAEERWKQLF